MTTTFEFPDDDPKIVEAILNINAAIRRIAPIHEGLPNRNYLGFKLELNEALADLEQAVRYLEGKEEPS